MGIIQSFLKAFKDKLYKLHKALKDVIRKFYIALKDKLHKWWSIFRCRQQRGDADETEEEEEEEEDFLQDVSSEIIEVISSQESHREETVDSTVSIHEIALDTVSIPNEEMVDSTFRTKRIAPEIVVPFKFHYEEFDLEEEEVGEITPMITIEDVVAKVDEEAKWIKHYSSKHRILLGGEGDFSFSASLAMAFSQASNMIATSLDSIGFLKTNYKKAPSNIEKLRRRGCKVMHGIDATEIADHPSLSHLKFDRIIYNFPFAGFFKDMPRKTQLKRHRRLVSLFVKNAKEMLSEDGEIHISHKTNGFHSEWGIELIASSHRLRLIEAVRFHQSDYPGYNTKYGFGGDGNFECHPSNTYKFGLRN